MSLSNWASPFLGLKDLECYNIDGLNISVTYCGFRATGNDILLIWSLLGDALNGVGFVGRGGSGTIWRVVPLCLIWCLWRDRNDWCFEGAEISVVKMKYLFLKTYMSGFNFFVFCRRVSRFSGLYHFSFVVHVPFVFALPLVYSLFLGSFPFFFSFSMKLFTYQKVIYVASLSIAVLI